MKRLFDLAFKLRAVAYNNEHLERNLKAQAKANEDSEELVLTWITKQTQKGARVSRNVIQTKAKRIFHTEIVQASKKAETFKESLSLRRKTMLAYCIQNKHVSFVIHKKSHLTMMLAAKADGTKFKPFIVFRGAKEKRQDYRMSKRLW
uniref:HTH CENPB-type domain-containing protein n=1 Tax=Oryzias latipes TaxID=8090 RepID=A0A3P9M7Y6_ORYLA